MPDNASVDRLRRLLQAARQAVESVSGSLDSLEGELTALGQEAEDRAEYYPALIDGAEVPQLTQEELDIASVKMLLTFREAAGLLSVPVATVRDMADRGELPVYEIGRTVRIPRKQLQECISEHGVSSPAKEEITAPGRVQRNRAPRAVHRDRKEGQKANAVDNEDETSAINAKPLLTIKEAAVVLRMHKIAVYQTAVYQLVSQNKLPSCRIGRSIRIPRKELQEYIEAAAAGEGGGRGSK